VASEGELAAFNQLVPPQLKNPVPSPQCIYTLRKYKESVSPMALSLKDPETDRLAREVARLTGESLTQAVRKALSERLERERLRRGKPARRLAEELDALAKECAALPDLDTRSPDEIIGYDENGLWR
jgi:antitoxin VapB